MTMPHFTWAFRLSATVVTTCFLGAVSPPCAHARPQEPPPINSVQRGTVANILREVHETLKHNYYDSSFHGVDIDSRYRAYDARIRAARDLPTAYRTIAAYLAGLDDSHTIFIPPEAGNRVLFGYRMQTIGDACFITDLRPGSDAARKLRRGDQVLSLDGYAVNSRDLWQLQYFLSEIALKSKSHFTLRGTDGATRNEMVEADVEHGQGFRYLSLINGHGDTDTWHLRLEREAHDQLQRSRTAEQDGVLFWKFPAFFAKEEEIDHVVGLARKHHAVILDLRGNSGGAEDVLALMVGSMFDRDVTIGRKIMRKGERLLRAKWRGQDAYSGQLIVLLDSASASAAEVFARVVQLEHRGTVIGDRSGGRVMDASVYPLREGAGTSLFYALLVSTADLLMADGKSLERVGVTPDVTVLPTALDLAEGRDPALSRAAALAGIKLDPASAAKLFPAPWPSQ